MSEFLFQNMTQGERIKILENTCLSKEVMEFSRSLSETELLQEKDLYCRDGMRIQKLESELKQLKDDFSAKIKAIEGTQTERLVIIANEKRQINDEVYLIADQANGRVKYVSKNGEVVHERGMNDEERQGRLFLGTGSAPAANTGNSPDGPAADITDIPHEEVKDDKDKSSETKPRRGRKKGVKQTPDNPSGQSKE